jgi:type IV secretory pathway protease TraF
LAVSRDFDAHAPRVVIDRQGRGIAVWQGRRVGEDELGEGLLMWSRFE